MAIVQDVKTLKPHNSNCQNCSTHTTELARWDVLTHPAELPKASHAYPFSHLIPGSVPATTKNSVFSVSYRLTAVAVPDNTKHDIRDPKNPNALMQFPNFIINHPLIIKRSIIRGPDKNSVRVFPPTDLMAQITIPSSVFPDSAFPFEMVVEGISVPPKSGDPNRRTRWGMRKLNWRIDELAQITGHRCPEHLNKPFRKPDSPSHGPRVPRTNRSARQAPVASSSRSPGVPLFPTTSNPPSPTLDPTDPPAPGSSEQFYITDTKSVSAGEIRSGWKTDFSGKGKIEFLADLNATMLSRTGCDIDDPAFGLKVSHVLVVELVVAEEAITSRTKQVMPTGAARVLRMQFNLNMTERSGLGIAWDDEVPPTYADVPLSPPEYENVAQLPTMEDVLLEHGEDYSRGIHSTLNAA